MKRRHDANLGTSATVKSKAEDFKKFSELINSEEFTELLDEVRKKTDSVAAAALMRKVLPIISLAGSRVRWGADEKRKLFTTLLNMRRHDDAASSATAPLLRCGVHPSPGEAVGAEHVAEICCHLGGGGEEWRWEWRGARS